MQSTNHLKLSAFQCKKAIETLAKEYSIEKNCQLYNRIRGAIQFFHYYLSANFNYPGSIKETDSVRQTAEN